MRQLFNFNGSVAVNWCILGLSSMQCLAFGLRWTTRRNDYAVTYIEFITNTLGIIDTGVKLALTWRHWSQYVRVLIWRLPVETLLMRSLVLQDNSWWSFSFAASARMTHAWRNFTMVSDYWQRKGQNSFKHEVLNVFVIGFCWLWLLANTILTVELLGDAGFLEESFSLPQQTSRNTQRKIWSLFQAFYFIIITITTVGLGDFKPESILGRLVVPFIILGGIAAFSLTTTKFLLLVKNQRIGLRHYRRYGSRLNVLVTGDPDLDSLVDFVLEFFHPEKFGVTYDMIILVPQRPMSSNGEYFFNKLRARVTSTEVGRSAIGQLWFHHGTIMNSHDVRLIIGTDAGGGGGMRKQHRPQCIWILPNAKTRHSEKEDAQNALRVLAARRAVEPYSSVRIIACALQSAELFLAAGLRPWDVLCIHEWRATLLGASCRVPCFGTFVSNLVFAVEEDKALVSAFNWEDSLIPSDDQENDNGDAQVNWRAAYEHSLGHELYGEPLGSTYRGWAFSDILHDIAAVSDYRVTLIGIVEISVIDERKEMSVYINPGSLYRVPLNPDVKIVGVFIASTTDAIIQSTGHPDLYGRRDMPDDDEYSDSSSATNPSSESSCDIDEAEREGRKMLEDRPPRCDFIDPERVGELWKEGVADGKREVARKILSSGALPIDDIQRLIIDPNTAKILKEQIREKMKAEEMRKDASPMLATRSSVTEATLQPPLKALTHPGPGCKRQRFVLLCCCGDLPGIDSLRFLATGCRMQVVVLCTQPAPRIQLLGSERTNSSGKGKVEYKIWYLRGDPLKAFHLRRAGYMRAKAIMVIGGHSKTEGDTRTSADVRQVFAVRLIEQLLNVDIAETSAGDPLAFLAARRPPVIGELSHEETHRLIPIRPDSATAPPPFIDAMAAPHDLEIYRCGRWAAGKVLLPSRVWTGVLVEAFRSESFMSVVENLLKHRSRPDGMAGVSMSHPMLLTNPPHELPLTKGDSLIVLRENHNHFAETKKDLKEVFARRPTSHKPSPVSTSIDLFQNATSPCEVPGISLDEEAARARKSFRFRRSTLAALVESAAEKGGDIEQEIELQEQEVKRQQEELAEAQRQRLRTFGSFGLASSCGRDSTDLRSSTNSRRTSIASSISTHRRHDEPEEAAVFVSKARRRRSSLAEDIMNTTDILKDYSAQRRLGESPPRGLLDSLARRSSFSPDGMLVLPQIENISRKGSILFDENYRRPSATTLKTPSPEDDAKSNVKHSGSSSLLPPSPEPQAIPKRRRISTSVIPVNPMDKFTRSTQ
ncbi:Calcium-activated potassium channel subunit alpha-1 [Perkinsus chesapeaki]|uniref:Calcium-activated potassium channel subunit alpha-1 n=1 Tax=Perkinsus chesapeaki TaxID=330153 RepID=A0A7J6MUP9_PERCH|nr:Calcium-activated potassium channel subunit alpha-1 [Perkinsus chesapeaki]